MKSENEPSFPEEILEDEKEFNLLKWVGLGAGRAWSVTEKHFRQRKRTGTIFQKK